MQCGRNRQPFHDRQNLSMPPSQQAMALQRAPLFNRRPRRITVTVADATYVALEQISVQEGRSLSNLAAFLLERSLEDLAHRPDTPALRERTLAAQQRQAGGEEEQGSHCSRLRRRTAISIVEARAARGEGSFVSPEEARPWGTSIFCCAARQASNTPAMPRSSTNKKQSTNNSRPSDTSHSGASSHRAARSRRQPSTSTQIKRTRQQPTSAATQRQRPAPILICPCTDRSDQPRADGRHN